MVERPVEHQVRIRAQPLVASLLPGDRVVPGEPDTKAPGRELVSGDDAVVDDEPRDGGIGCSTIRLERVGARRIGLMGVACALESVRDRVPNPAGFDTSLPTLQTSAHGARVGEVFRSIQGFFCVAAICSKAV